ncbi:MAG TPA: HepT-like ribonuclease domain-containing protein [Chloroflexota bacterium]|nr:HepT-like ribonuclease domain-containing protein [Chloroflexota bacterium]
MYAVVRCFEIIGEAAKRVPQSIRESNPGLPWKLMAGMRDRLVHNYVDVNHAVLWATFNEDLPALIAELRSITDGH